MLRRAIVIDTLAVPIPPPLAELCLCVCASVHLSPRPPHSLCHGDAISKCVCV